MPHIRAGRRVPVHGAALCAVLVVCLRYGGDHVHRVRARRGHTDNGRQHAAVRVRLRLAVGRRCGGCGRADRVRVVRLCCGVTVAGRNNSNADDGGGGVIIASIPSAP